MSRAFASSLGGLFSGAGSGAAAGSGFGLPGMLAGGALGAVGNLIGGGGNEGPSSQQLEAQARANRYTDEEYIYGGMARQLAAILGPEKARQVLQGSMSQDAYSRLFGRAAAPIDRASVESQIKAIEDRLRPYRAERGNRVDDRAAAAAGINVQSELNRIRELQTMLTTGTDPGQTGTIDGAAFDRMGSGVMGEYDNLTKQATQQGRDALKGYNADTARLLEMARGIEGGAQQYGQQERERINRDSSRALTSANRATESRLMGRGFGASTALTQQLTGNARQMEEARQDALGSLGDRQIGMLNQLRGNTLGLAGQRATGQTGLVLGNQDRTMGFNQQALGLKTNLLSGSVTNPWLSRSTGSYVPGLAPSQPSSSANWGNWLTGLGGQAFNIGAMDWMRQNGIGGTSQQRTG